MSVLTKRLRPAQLPQWMRFRTLRTRLTVLIGVPLLLLQITVISLEYVLGRANELTEMQQELDQLTRLIVAQIDRQLAMTVEVGRLNAHFFADHPQLTEYERYRLLRRMVADHTSIEAATLAFEPWISHRILQIVRTASGHRLEVRELNGPDIDVRGQAWYRRARTEARPFWINSGTKPNENGPATATYIVPIMRNGGFAGAVSVGLEKDLLRSQLAGSDVQGVDLTLFDDKGDILADDDVETGGAHRATAEPAGLHRIAGPGNDNRGRWVLQAPVPTTGWSLRAEFDEQAALREVRTRLLRQSLIYGLGTAGILALVWWIAGVITRPLGALADAARRVANGQIESRVKGPLEHDEIGQFAQAFNKMLDDLETNTAARLSEAAMRQAVESELEIGLKIQQSLMPKTFSGNSAIDIAGHFMPARYVAGDFFDWFEVAPDTIALVIADVSGKGVPAALFMAVARTALRSAGAGLPTPASALTALNRILFEENPLTMFVTLFYGHYHLPSGRLVYANAGHNPPYIVRASHVVEPLGTATGPLLAVFPEISITEEETHLRPNDVLVLYTDGVTEAIDAEGRLYGEKRLELLLRNTAGNGPDGVCQRIAHAVGEHCQGAPQDDVTLLVLRRNT